MRPWIWPGGQLHIRPCGVDELRVGDIAVWFNGTRLLSHRVIAIREDGSFVTRGDWYERADSPAEAHQLVGVAVRFSLGRISYSVHRSAKSAWLARTEDIVRDTIRALRRR